jgi:hypothetical protein
MRAGTIAANDVNGGGVPGLTAVLLAAPWIFSSWPLAFEKRKLHCIRTSERSLSATRPAPRSFTHCINLT